MSTSLKDKIEERFAEVYRTEPNRWVVKEKVCEFAKKYGYSSENAGRRLRECESGRLSDGKTCPKTLEVKYEKGAKGQTLAYYKWKPQEKESLKSIISSVPNSIRVFDELGV